MKWVEAIRGVVPSTRSVGPLVQAAGAASRAQRWADAASAWAAVVRRAPARPGYWVQYGHALKEQGFLAEAEAAYLRALRLDPGAADTHLQIGHVLRLQGRDAEAIVAYEAAHRLDQHMQHGRAELADLRRTPVHEVSGGRVATVVPAGTAAAAVAVLTRHGLHPALLQVFDPFYYHQASPAVRAAVAVPSRLACLEHFCRAGIDLVLPISAGHAFDPAFYLDSALGGMRFTPANAYRHWLNVGLPRGAAPNRGSWVQARLGRSAGTLEGIDLVAFSAQTDPAAAASRWTVLAERFIAEAADPARAIVVDERSAPVFDAIAVRLAGGTPDERDRALRLRQIIARSTPDHPGNRLAYAQLLLDRGIPAEAARVFEALADGPNASPAVFCGLGHALDALGSPADGLAALREGCRRYPDQEPLRLQRRDQARRMFGTEWMLAMAEARAGRQTQGRARIRAVADVLCGGRQAPAVPPRELRRVAIVSHASMPQCRVYRIDQLAEQLQALGCHVVCFDLAEDQAGFHAALHALDAAMFIRVPALPDAMEAIFAAHDAGLVTIYDIDDLIFSDAFPEPLDAYAGQITAEEHHGLALATPLFEAAMRLCHRGVASTGSLAAAMRPLLPSGIVDVRPNGLGARHLAFVAQAPRPAQDRARPVTVFHGSGTRAHKRDFETLLLPALVELVRRHPGGVAIVLVGHFPDSAALRSIADHVTILDPVWDLESYWSLLAQADINLAVIQPSAVTDAKSEIKWLEAAMLGIPSIVSATATYREVVRPGETGLLCTTTAEWTATLLRLVSEPALRQRIGAQAREAALAAYGPDTLGRTQAAILAGAGHDGPSSAHADQRPLMVVVNVFYPPQAYGGATRVVHDNVRDLLAMPDCPVRIAVFASLDRGAPYAIDTVAEEGVRVTRVGGSSDDPAWEYRGDDPRMGEIFGEYLDASRPALVHFHCVQRLTAALATAARDRGIPYVVTLHDGWWISDHQFLLDDDGLLQTYDIARPLPALRRHGTGPYLRMMSLAHALAGARHVLAVSEPFAALHRASGIAGVRTLENGVSRQLQPRREPGQGGKVRLGFIGGLARHKGVDLVRIALEARAWDNLSLLLIDHGLAPGTRRQERWGTVTVDVEPSWPQDRVADLYARIDVLLAPSIWPESFGLVTREAAMAGCWIVASDRGSIAGPVDPGRNGFVVGVDSPDGLIAALAAIEAAPQRYLVPPPAPARPLRTARDQARDLAALYAEMLAEAAATPTA